MRAQEEQNTTEINEFQSQVAQSGYLGGLER